MSLHIEFEFSLPSGWGTHHDFDAIVDAKGSEEKIFFPIHRYDALCLQKAVHDYGAGEVAIAMPAFDHANGFLKIPDHPDLTVEPLLYGGNRFAVFRLPCKQLPTS